MLPKIVTRKTQFQRVILLIIGLSCLLCSLAGNANELDKETLTALYTYKFGKFTRWPNKNLNSATKNFEYCILGVSPFSQMTMNMIIGKTVQGKPLTINVFGSGLIPETVLATCHILFISKSEKHRLSTIFHRLKKLSVLTISDIHGFSYLGGMITLIDKQNQLRFQINPLALQQANISISSKILKLAEIVGGGQRL